MSSEQMAAGETGSINDAANAQEKPLATLLSSISYTNREDYDNFLKNLTPDHALIVLIASANHAQSRGAFNLEEAELVAKAIKRITTKDSTSGTVGTVGT